LLNICGFSSATCSLDASHCPFPFFAVEGIIPILTSTQTMN
jgi:hypothetical protein